MSFPKSFEERMKALLKDEYEAFVQSYDAKPHTGLKVNTHKIDIDTFVKQFPYPLTPVPWAEDGFYYNEEDPVTKHPYFYAGLYYIQEPSAMAPANLLKPHPGDAVLDLCAAPGGKSMQLSNFIKDDGILVTNDLNDNRIKALIRNVERFGLRNVVILNESPDHIAKALGHVFDAILIDAPCSGEGMFNKDPKAKKAYEKFGPEVCAKMQYDILETIPELIHTGGRVAYSTCTFAPMENEDQIEGFMKRYPSFEGERILKEALETNGHMARIWPHRQRGEGHFMALMHYKGDGEPSQSRMNQTMPKENEWFEAFKKQHILSDKLDGEIEVIKDKVYLLPKRRLNLKGLKVVREGLLLGELKKNKFVPYQTLAMAIRASDFSPVIHLSSESLDVKKYLKGETLQVETSENGYHLVCVDNYPLGFAKVDNGVFKNMYAASWRLL